MKPKRALQEHYYRLSKIHKVIYPIFSCFMLAHGVFMCVFAFIQHRPLWLSVVLLVVSILLMLCAFTSIIFILKLRKLKKRIDGTPRGNAEDTGGVPRDDGSHHEE